MQLRKFIVLILNGLWAKEKSKKDRRKMAAKFAACQRRPGQFITCRRDTPPLLAFALHSRLNGGAQFITCRRGTRSSRVWSLPDIVAPEWGRGRRRPVCPKKFMAPVTVPVLLQKQKRPEISPARFFYSLYLSSISSYLLVNHIYQPFAFTFPLFLAQRDH